MDNKLKSKTRLAAIQLVSQHLINNQDIKNIKDDFDKYYRNTTIDDSLNKIQYNVNWLRFALSKAKTRFTEWDLDFNDLDNIKFNYSTISQVEVRGVADTSIKAYSIHEGEGDCF